MIRDAGYTERLARFQQRLIDAGFPERQATLDPARATGAEWQAVGRRLAAMVGSGYLIALIGGSGTGKTQMAAALATLYTGKPILYGKAMRLFLDLRAAMGTLAANPATRQSERGILKEYIDPAFLALDEAGERGGSEWEDRMLAYLIDERYAARKDTLLISNQQEAAFLDGIGPRIASRLQETGGIVVCDWPSFREGQQ
jgi:DNA replication protein DnaC